MRLQILVLVLTTSGCSGARALTIVNHGGLVAQSTALVCDWGQTRRAAALAATGENWRSDTPYESNPIMGGRPTTSTIDLYFFAALGLSAAAWRVLPRRWRFLVPVAVLALEADPIASNFQLDRADLGFCGIR